MIRWSPYSMSPQIRRTCSGALKVGFGSAAITRPFINAATTITKHDTGLLMTFDPRDRWSFSEVHLLRCTNASSLTISCGIQIKSATDPPPEPIELHNDVSFTLPGLPKYLRGFPILADADVGFSEVLRKRAPFPDWKELLEARNRLPVLFEP